MKDTTKYIMKRVFVLLLLAVTGGSAWAQVTGNQYTTSYDGTTITNVSIAHKSPKWTQYHEGKGYNDTYNETDMVTLENNAQVQASNAYVDTIYVHKGTSVTLTLPYRVADSNASIYNYLRWFDYRTDGNYNCGSGTNVVNDLLTPALSDRTTYRFANGYATINGKDGSASMTKMNFYYPTDSEFSNYTSGFNNGDNSYYIVACDASIYTDFAANNTGIATTFGSTNNWCEPTLSGRAIYYIVGVEDETTNIPSAFAHYWDLLNTSYQGGGNTGTEHYVDEYEITYPTRRFSNNTAEMVALNKDANAYAIPGVTATNDPGTLNVTLIDNANLGFNLTFSQALESKDGVTDGTRTIIPPSADKSGIISGNDRIIFFYKGTLGGVTSTTAMTTVPTDTQWNVPDGSTITILVTKTISGTTYNLARYKVNFSDDANLLTQTQVAGLSSLTGSEGYWWDDQTQRSPDYMESNYTQVASLLFDYDTSVNADEVLPNGQQHFYPFPMNWSSNGYAFYDGVTSADANTTFDNWGSTTTSGYTLSVGTRFSMYSITNDYIGYWDSPNRTGYASPPTNLVKDDNGYWLYIDASERPGTVAEITIDGDLCAGSKLFGTAWIKGAGGANSVDAGALFSIGGVTVNSDGTETHTPILRQATGQVRVTTRITEDDVNEPNLGSTVTGKGADTNEWFQVYFSFVSDENHYDYYTLRVDNYCAGTDGGDYYFDELKVYVLTPTVVMAELEPLCTTNDTIGRSLIRMDLDYESMMARLGLEPSDYSDETETNKEDGTAHTASVDFVIINEAKYYNAIAAGTDAEDAFKDALVTFWGTGDDASDGHIFPTLDFYCNYELNEKYDEDSPGSNIVTFGGTHDGVKDDTDEAYFYYRINENDAIELSMDCFTNMVAYTEYMILIEPHTETSKSDNQKLDEFMALMNDVCAIKTEFSMSASITLKINGETADPEADYCAGQTLVISPEVSYTDEDGNNIYLEDVYFDWFFGSIEEYTAANSDYNGVSLYEALLNFRTYYPDAEELSETATPPTGDFTENDYKIIYYYLHTATDNYSNMLVLHMSHLSMRVLTTGLELVIQPIEIYLPEGLDICFGYVPLTLYSSGDAPTLKSGFHNIESPDGYDPCLRLGLAQLEKSSSSNPIIVNLCKATYVADTSGDVTVDHLGVGGSGMEYLYLVDTNDPVYHEVTLSPDFTQYDLPVGKIVHLYATNDDKSDNETVSSHSYMQIYFFDEGENSDPNNIGKAFTAKEGYYYVLDVHFEEETEDNDSIGAVCYGILPLEIKVVPEYLVWTGNKSANWNYDNHWRRADWTDIHMADSASYVTNYQNGADRGYVPMLFTKVIIPKNSVSELYMSGFLPNGTTHSDGSSQMLEWVGDDSTSPTTHDDVSEEPTYNIMYDLMLYENASGALKTEHYRVNLCDQIHLEPGAQVLHSEQLIYNKAWTEVLLPQGPWTLQATPLRDVVSGDWYTKTSGTETAEYFTDITFNTTNNNRYTPLLYQRSWGTDDKVILENYTGTSGATSTTSVPSYASTGWSSVYNDTSVPYQSGEGFSIKGNLSNYDDNFDSADSLMFRFPKADTEYTISSATANFDRTNANKLLVSDLVTRTVDKPDNDDDTDIYTGTVEVTLTQTGNGYYIIGNPFTAPMSMKEFMAGNTDIKGYWLESTYGPIVGTTDENGNPVNSWGNSDVLVDPYCAFFVTTDENDLSPLADTPVTVTFTKDMQEETISTTRLEHMHALSLRATNDAGTTSAALLYDDSATDDYRLGEDAILLEDISWQHEGTPMVYTIAGDMAVGVNRVNSMPQVPLGVFADDDCAYTITFVGVDCLNEPSLFDSYTNTDTALTEGFTLNMEGASHGRYFIRSKGAATEISLTENALFDITAYSPTSGTVIVSSTAELEDICVYSVGGMLLRQVNAGNNYSCTIEGINSGIAIVRAKTSEGTFVKKLRVR